MEHRGTDGVMVARNRVRRLLREKGSPSEEACALACHVVCGDEGLTIEDVFPREEARQLAEGCLLACRVPAGRQVTAAG